MDNTKNLQIINNIFENIHTEVQVAKLKRQIMRDKFWANKIKEVRKIINNKVDADGQMPNNPELIKLYELICYDNLLDENGNKLKVINTDGSDIKLDSKVVQILKRLKVRSNSGVAVVSLLTKPYTCPGRCVYCPTEKNMPKSYLSREPAAARALLNKFDPYKQIMMRLEALTLNGHPVDKIEMIFIGGTWNFYDKKYQEWFTKESFRACNNWKALEDGRDFIENDHQLSLLELQKINETAHARIIGLSIETRPDYITSSELKWLRILGVTKVELGVQHLDNEVLKYNKRDMSREAMALGTEMLRNYGFKLVYHMMPNLPGSNPSMDVQMFRELYNGLDFHPDMMKIYPNMVLKGSLLYKLVTQKKIPYEAYDDATLTHVLADCESYVPNYTRLIRMIRDIPADYIIIGSKKSNLREEVDKYQKQRGIKQVDIRAREIRDIEIDVNMYELTDTIYKTRTGTEHFLQFENKNENKLAGFLRLRLPELSIEQNEKLISIPSEAGENWGLKNWREETENFNKKYKNNIDETLDGAALIRELHVYGTMKRVGEEGTQSQHTGMGKKLLLKAEEIAKNNGYKKIAIIAGVGVREYYKKRGYEEIDTYMVKELK